MARVQLSRSRQRVVAERSDSDAGLSSTRWMVILLQSKRQIVRQQKVGELEFFRASKS